MSSRISPRRLFALCLLVLLSAAALAATDPALPKSWIDATTGRRVIRLTDTPGSATLYFNDGCFTPDGHEVVYTVTSDKSCHILDLRTGETRLVAAGPVKTICMGRKTPSAYYVKREGDVQVLYSTNVDTGETRRRAVLPGRGALYTVNADETLVAGTYVPGDPPTFGGRAGFGFPDSPQVDPLEQDPKKGTLMADRFAAHLPIVLYLTDLATGESRTLMNSTDWLNHLQFSPTDPNLLMYCHEGPWQLVDRIWTVRTDGSRNHLVHQRTMEMEIAGHEWWSESGDAIWYQLHYPPALGINFIASENVNTGARVRYLYNPDAASIHHNLSPDGTFFCGDGTKGNPWIVICRPVLSPDQNTHGTNLTRTGTLKVDRLVDMSKHNYALEPNPIFTPDQKLVLFRSNMLGETYVFAVEIAKAVP
ncbi:MAG TPA: oligogalacturonate lyase family protein [Opitutaceae bacterium]|nr:oligogalacturonate lyase family protein [Opitutaceae bacterium]